MNTDDDDDDSDNDKNNDNNVFIKHHLSRQPIPRHSSYRYKNKLTIKINKHVAIPELNNEQNHMENEIFPKYII